MKENKTYAIEKRFAEVFALLPRDDVFIRETPSKTYFITVPHPTDDVEYILSTWQNPKAPREFVDLGRCMTTALRMGAASIRFDITPLTPEKK